MLFKNANIFVGGQFQHGSFRVENGRFAEILTTVPAEDGIDLEISMSFRVLWTSTTMATPARTFQTATMTDLSKWRAISHKTA